LTTRCSQYCSISISISSCISNSAIRGGSNDSGGGGVNCSKCSWIQ